MRGLLLLLLGLASGVVGAVLLFTLVDTFDTGGPERTGGGNARVELEQSALSYLIQRRAELIVPENEPLHIGTTIYDTGNIEIRITIGEIGVAEESRIVLDPEVVDGKLEFTVVESELAEDMPSEAQLASILMRPLYDQLSALAGGGEYRLTSITTRDGMLRLEVQL